MKKPISVSIGIFAYNEEQNIKKVLDSILKQHTQIAFIKEIIIISSGSYDRTNQIARQYEKKDNRIRLIEQLERRGKSSAINKFLKIAKAPISVVISSDLRLHTKAIEEITIPFLHKKVGMAGAHPIPINTQHSQFGKEIRLLWQLHHLVALKNPKCGEMIAFRNVIRSIPKQSAVDEANLEVLLKLIGFKVVYAPRAIVYNKGPRTIQEFLTQRRRVYAGHQWVVKQYNYQVSTLGFSSTFQTIIAHLFTKPNDTIPMIRLVALEAWGRVLGWWDYHILGKNQYIWNMIER